MFPHTPQGTAEFYCLHSRSYSWFVAQLGGSFTYQTLVKAFEIYLIQRWYTIIDLLLIKVEIWTLHHSSPDQTTQLLKDRHKI